MELFKIVTKIKEEGYVLGSNEEELESVLLDKTRTKMLKGGIPKVVTLYEVKIKKYNTKSYEEIVEGLIAEKYSIGNQIALLRQKSEKPSEYDKFFEFAEECKTKAKEFIAERDKLWKKNQ